MAAEGEPHREIELPPIGTLVGDKYVLEGMLGHGGMAAVFAARHTVTQKPVAVKWMLPVVLQRESGAERFMREAQVAGMIDHPNVVDIYDVGQQDGACYLVMELLRGRPLDEILDDGRTTLDELLGYVADAARGVHAAHARGVLHRDLKPENIFVCDSPDGYTPPYAKVLDFGISKLVNGEEHGVSRLTQTGAMLGTPYYMSPEQATGGITIDVRSDVYAMGTVLFECCTGDIPFDGTSYNELIVKIATTPAPAARQLNPKLPDELDDVVAHAMAHDRRHRYKDMTEFLDALTDARKGMDDAVRHQIPTSSTTQRSTTALNSGGAVSQSGIQVSDDGPATDDEPPQARDNAHKQLGAAETLEFDPAAPVPGVPRPADASGEGQATHATEGAHPRAAELASTQTAAFSETADDDRGRGVPTPIVVALVAAFGLLVWLLASPTKPPADDEAPGESGAVAAPSDAPDPEPAGARPSESPPTAGPAGTGARDEALPTDSPGEARAPTDGQPTAGGRPPSDGSPATDPPRAGRGAATPEAAAPAPKPPRPRTPRRRKRRDAVEAEGLSGTMRSDDF